MPTINPVLIPILILGLIILSSGLFIIKQQTAAIIERFGKESNIVVWTNPIFGEVLVDGVKFAEVPVIKKAVKDGSLFAVIQIPILHRMTQEDFAVFLKEVKSSL